MTLNTMYLKESMLTILGSIANIVKGKEDYL